MIPENDQQDPETNPKTTAPGSSGPASAEELKDKEKDTPPDRSGHSAADDINERLGRGYTGKGSTKSKFLSKLYNSKSATKQKVAIAVAAAGTSAGLSFFLFIALLPLKIDNVIKNVESKYSAEAADNCGLYDFFATDISSCLFFYRSGCYEYCKMA